MSAFNIEMIAEDLRQIKGMIEVIKHVSHEQLNVLKNLQDIEDDIKRVALGLKITLNVIKLNIEGMNPSNGSDSTSNSRQRLLDADYERP